MDVSFPRSIFAAPRAAKEAVLELLLPPACRLCNSPIAPGGQFCRSCELSLTVSETMMRAACRRCGIPAPRAAEHELEQESEENVDSDAWTPQQLRGVTNSEPAALAAGAERTPNRLAGPEAGAYGSRGKTDSSDQRLPGCVHCRNMKICFDSVATMWAYQDRVCEAIVAAKFAHHCPLGDAMGRRLGDRVREVFRADYPDWVTYVPSHVTRQLARGGNGSQVIAAAVAQVIGRPCRQLLRTTRRIDKQAWLEDAERIENVRDAFSLRRSYAFPRPPEIAHRHVLVVDDVLTTGATANEVASVLRGGGARRVSLAVVARALRSQ